ncbi:MAG: VOC family protein [Nocardioidaceae bacterium]|nr:VOC family protein [Nocardioidaceae bacterium]
MSNLTGLDIAAAGLTDWSYVGGALQTRLATGSFAVGMRLVQSIGEAAEAADHHPDLDLRYPSLDVRLSSHDVGAVTERDVALARTISELAAAEGVSGDGRMVKRLEVALDTPDLERVIDFWGVVLDMPVQRPEGGGPELRDDVLPTMWFQPSGTDEPRQRFHLDLWVPPEVVEERIAAAVAAGGTLVSDQEAPAFWVLADVDGNQVCLCTWQDRDADPS